MTLDRLTAGFSRAGLRNFIVTPICPALAPAAEPERSPALPMTARLRVESVRFRDM
jgi:hypothetical protein